MTPQRPVYRHTTRSTAKVRSRLWGGRPTTTEGTTAAGASQVVQLSSRKQDLFSDVTNTAPADDRAAPQIPMPGSTAEPGREDSFQAQGEDTAEQQPIAAPQACSRFSASGRSAHSYGLEMPQKVSLQGVTGGRYHEITVTNEHGSVQVLGTAEWATVQSDLGSLAITKANIDLEPTSRPGEGLNQAVLVKLFHMTPERHGKGVDPGKYARMLQRSLDQSETTTQHVSFSEEDGLGWTWSFIMDLSSTKTKTGQAQAPRNSCGSRTGGDELDLERVLSNPLISIESQ